VCAEFIGLSNQVVIMVEGSLGLFRGLSRSCIASRTGVWGECDRRFRREKFRHSIPGRVHVRRSPSTLASSQIFYEIHHCLFTVEYVP
jgi:hypothetical protein